MNSSTLPLVDVLVCTFRRPELLVKTLDGITRCAGLIGPVRVIVVDNDDRLSARDVVKEWSAKNALQVDYFSQPMQNISLTRNVALNNVTAPWTALIDDDEVPDEDWLHQLINAADEFKADVVFAPVISEFAPAAPRWAVEGSVFQRKRFQTGSLIPHSEMRTSNVLLRTVPLKETDLQFDSELGLSGGEDSHFFSQLADKGFKMVWCDSACVREWTPPSRTTLSWVLKRAFRIGSVEAYNRMRLKRYLHATIFLAKFSLLAIKGSLLTLMWAPISSPKCVKSLRLTVMGAGYIYGMLFGPYLEYRKPSALSDSAV